MMKYFLHILFFLLLANTCNALVALPINNANTDSISNNKITISVLTCGAGAELYSSWGHSALRVIDSNANTDIVYNYGMFDFGDPNFYRKYIKGTLLYYGAGQEFESFMYEYKMDGREVKEQVLYLNNIQKNKLLNALALTLTEENKNYHYDFLYVNCSTKLRDLLDSALKPNIQFVPAIAADSLKYMHDLNSYLQNKHWERLGIDLLLSSEVNKKMTPYKYMYLPEALFRGLAKTTLDGNNLVSTTNYLLPNAQVTKSTTNLPRIVSGAFALLLIVLSFIMRNSKLLKILDVVFFTILGLLGCLFLFMWLGTNHLQTKHNLNLLWCLPTHIAMPYFIFSKKNNTIYFTVSVVLAVLAAILAIFYSTAWEVYPLIIAAIVRLYFLQKSKNLNHAKSNI